jgi:hypothetical protein
LNCETLELWDKADFKNFTLTHAQATQLAYSLDEDSKDLYYKGLLSLCEALRSIEDGQFSWGTIKIYYSVYYLLRSTLALNGIAIVRQRSLYCLRATRGEQPLSKNHKRYNSDHSATINYFIDFFSDSDYLLSQRIDDMDVYSWLMKKREQINYRERTFNEPGYSVFWDHIVTQIKQGGLEKLVHNYISDQDVMCFQEENAAIAVPIKRALLTKELFNTRGVMVTLSDPQRDVLRNLLPFKIKELEQLFV